MGYCKKYDQYSPVTLTTGPFHVPRYHEGDSLVNNLLVITIKNPTNQYLRAHGYIELCPGCDDLVGSSVQIDGSSAAISCENVGWVSGCLVTETRLCEFSVCLEPDKCVTFQIDIGNYPNATLRITAKGDFEVFNCMPICGKLEISVTGGVGAANTERNSSGLDFAEPTMFFRYHDFVVCNRKC